MVSAAVEAREMVVKLGKGKLADMMGQLTAGQKNDPRTWYLVDTSTSTVLAGDRWFTDSKVMVRVPGGSLLEQLLDRLGVTVGTPRRMTKVQRGKGPIASGVGTWSTWDTDGQVPGLLALESIANERGRVLVGVEEFLHGWWRDSEAVIAGVDALSCRLAAVVPEGEQFGCQEAALLPEGYVNMVFDVWPDADFRMETCRTGFRFEVADSLVAVLMPSWNRNGVFTPDDDDRVWNISREVTPARRIRRRGGRAA